MCSVARETTQCSSAMLEKLLQEGSPFFFLHVSPHLGEALRDMV